MVWLPVIDVRSVAGLEGFCAGQSKVVEPTMVRELDLADDALASAAHQLAHRAYSAEAALIGCNAIPPLHESLPEMRSRPLRWVGFFAEDGSLAAFLAWQALPDGTIEIDRLCVDPAWFRRGLASRLLEEILRLGQATLVSTAERNLPATRLYERWGFLRTGSSRPPGGPVIATFRRAPSCRQGAA